MVFLSRQRNKLVFNHIWYHGNFAKWRGLETLLKAYLNLHNQNTQLIIVGSGWNNLIREWTKKLGDSVVYFEKVSHEKLKNLYAEADIFVQPYIYPVPIGRTLVEALQSGLAVITTGNDYYSPVVRNEKDGILIYPMDAKILEEKLQILIDDKLLRRRLGENGKKRVFEICSPDKVVKRYLKVYEGVLK